MATLIHFEIKLQTEFKLHQVPPAGSTLKFDVDR